MLIAGRDFLPVSGNCDLDMRGVLDGLQFCLGQAAVAQRHESGPAFAADCAEGGSVADGQYAQAVVAVLAGVREDDYPPVVDLPDPGVRDSRDGSRGDQPVIWRTLWRAQLTVASHHDNTGVASPVQRR